VAYSAWSRWVFLIFSKDDSGVVLETITPDQTEPRCARP
jgi:hypothetical protein